MAARILLASSVLVRTKALSLDTAVNASADALNNATGYASAGASVDAAFQDAAMLGCIKAPMSFDDFIETYGRSYRRDSLEYDMRAELFKQRQDLVRVHNCAAVRSDGPLWTASVNHLSDWTHLELMRLRGHKSNRGSNAAAVNRAATSFLANRGSIVEANDFPTEFSWANLSTIMAPSEDQGDCGSCWAMASGVVIRSRAEIKGIPHRFSTEQMISCTLNPHKCGGSGGCDGATAELAYEYVLRAGLVSTDTFKELRKDLAKQQLMSINEKVELLQAPSSGRRTQCPEKLSVETEVATQGIIGSDGSEVHLLSEKDTRLKGMNIGMRGWTKFPENKEEPMMRSLLQDGPLYVAVAVGEHWHYYSGGVMTEEGCDPRNVINHAVTLFAWGVKEKTRIGPVKYWALKNSWGPHWGENGSLRLRRKDDEEKQCGWDVNPQEGNGCEGGPAQVWVCGTCGILYDAVAPHF